jgi:hypothetical protein
MPASRAQSSERRFSFDFKNGGHCIPPIADTDGGVFEADGNL